MEKVLELAHETFKDLFDQLGLHLGRKLLIQTILLDNQVEIEMEGISDCEFNLLSEFTGQEVGLLAEFNLFHPDVHLRELYTQ